MKRINFYCFVKNDNAKSLSKSVSMLLNEIAKYSRDNIETNNQETLHKLEHGLFMWDTKKRNVGGIVY
jgi:hypothetical protein